MPPGPTAPCSLAGLLAEFRPCFTAPTFHTFVGLVVGLIAQTRRRTVCGMLTGAGLDQVWHHSRAHRLFTNARWSGDALGLALADLIVARLLPADSALTIAVDDTFVQAVREEGLRRGVASRRGGEGPMITGERHLTAVLREYVQHYDTHRPHRSLGQRPPAARTPPHAAAILRPLRRDRLGGLIHEYVQVA